MKPTTKNVLYMLRESNAIESVYDRYALVNAHRAWKYLQTQDKLTPQNIKEMHRLLMVGQPIEQKYRGDWRDRPVTVGKDVRSQSKPLIDSLIRDFCDHVNEVIETQNQNHQPALCCHVKYEDIHPFIDGNGRTGRIILNWQCLKLGMPLLVYTEEKKHVYYRLFPSYRRMEMERVWKALQSLPL